MKEELQALQSIGCNDAFKARTKELILTSIKSEANDVSFVDTLSLTFKQFTRQLSAKPLGVMILVAGIIIGPGIATVSAARASLPGDTLYTLKRGLENVELSLTFSDKKKAEKKIEHVATRLTELHRITQEQSPSPEREQKMVLALEELKKDTDDVNKRLQTAKDDNDVTENDVVELARIIEEKTSDYKETLKSSKDHLSDDIAANVEEIDLALSTVQEVAIGALNIIAEEEASGESEISKEDLKTRVESQLQTVQEQIAGLLSRVDLANGLAQELASLTAPQPESNNESDNPIISEEPAKNEILTNLSESISKIADEQISYISELIEMGELRTALDEISSAKSRADELALELRVYRVSLETQLQSIPQPEEQNVSDQESVEDEPSNEESDKANMDEENVEEPTAVNEDETTTDETQNTEDEPESEQSQDESNGEE